MLSIADSSKAYSPISVTGYTVPSITIESGIVTFGLSPVYPVIVIPSDNNSQEKSLNDVVSAVTEHKKVFNIKTAAAKTILTFLNFIFLLHLLNFAE